MAGTLQALGRKERGCSIELGEGFVNEVKLKLICEGEHAAEAISLICKNAQIGQPVAGRIYVIDAVESIPIEKEQVLLRSLPSPVTNSGFPAGKRVDPLSLSTSSPAKDARAARPP